MARSTPDPSTRSARATPRPAAGRQRVATGGNPARPGAAAAGGPAATTARSGQSGNRSSHAGLEEPHAAPPSRIARLRHSSNGVSWDAATVVNSCRVASAVTAATCAARTSWNAACHAAVVLRDDATSSLGIAEKGGLAGADCGEDVAVGADDEREPLRRGPRERGECRGRQRLGEEVRDPSDDAAARVTALRSPRALDPAGARGRRRAFDGREPRVDRPRAAERPPLPAAPRLPRTAGSRRRRRAARGTRMPRRSRARARPAASPPGPSTPSDRAR